MMLDSLQSVKVVDISPDQCLTSDLQVVNCNIAIELNVSHPVDIKHSIILFRWLPIQEINRDYQEPVPNVPKQSSA